MGQNLQNLALDARHVLLEVTLVLAAVRAARALQARLLAAVVLEMLLQVALPPVPAAALVAGEAARRPGGSCKGRVENSVESRQMQGEGGA